LKRYKLISSLIKERLKNKLGAEIGVWKGQTSEYLLNHHKKLRLICVDPYKKYEHYDKHHNWGAFDSQRKLNQLAEVVRCRLQRNFGNRVIWLKRTSIEAAKGVDDGALDFCFLDGNWGFEYVKQDVEIWLPKIRKGGVLIGHRINSNKDGFQCVKRAVDEVLGGYGYKIKGGRWFYVV
jgi:predicted O-methyltransferase YrrM